MDDKKELSDVEVEWIAFLIGKIKADELGEENKLKFEQEQAAKKARLDAGEVPLKPEFLIF